MTTNAILLYDGHQGIYIPKIFAEDILSGYVKAKNFDEVKWELSELGNIDNELYWDAWNQMLSKVVLVDKFGKEYYLHQDNDVWAIPVGEEVESY